MKKRNPSDDSAEIKYQKIFSDIIARRIPERASEFEKILSKEKLSSLDIIRLNKAIFTTANKENNAMNQMFRSYNEKDILEILKYQKVNQLSNTQVAEYFKLSRNTVGKWKKFFIDRV